MGVTAVRAILTTKNALEVSIDDKVVGYIKKDSKVTDKTLKETVIASLEADKGTKIKTTQDISLKEAHEKSKNLVTYDSIVSSLKEQLVYQVNAAVIYVDGVKVLALNNAGEFEDVKNDLVSKYLNSGEKPDESGFLEDVQVKDEFVDMKEIISKQDAKDKLTVPTDVQKEHIVVSSDSFWGIALQYNKSQEELSADNPQIKDVKKLKPGDKIIIKMQKPYVSIRTVVTTSTTAIIPRGTKYEEDSTRKTTYQVTSSPGKDGEKTVVKKTVKINGIKTGVPEEESVVTVEPEDKVVTKGTQK